MADQDSARGSEESVRANTMKSGIAALAGLVVYFLMTWLKTLVPTSVMANRSPLPFPASLYARFEFQLLCFVIFPALAWFRRGRPDAWIPAFLAGMGLPHVLLHWL